MDQVSNEMLFYAGLAVAALALICGIFFTIIYVVGKKKLEAKFDIEYGETGKKTLK